MPPEILERDLASLKRFAKIGLLSAQGGEPLLHSDIMGILRIMKESEIADSLAILTNGRLLDRVPEGFWERLAEYGVELRISVYQNLPQEIITMAIAMSDQFKFSLRVNPINAFVKLFKKQDDPQGIYNICPWRRCLTLHDGWFYLCPLSTFFPSQYMGLDEHIDGICLDGMTDESFEAFLNRETYLESCRICGGGSTEWLPWHENKNQTEWEQEAGLYDALPAVARTNPPRE